MLCPMQSTAPSLSTSSPSIEPMKEQKEEAAVMIAPRDTNHASKHQ